MNLHRIYVNSFSKKCRFFLITAVRYIGESKMNLHRIYVNSFSKKCRFFKLKKQWRKTGLQEHTYTHSQHCYFSHYIHTHTHSIVILAITYVHTLTALLFYPFCFSGCLRAWPDHAHWKPQPQWGKLKMLRFIRSTHAISLLSSAQCDARPDLTSAPPCSFSLMLPRTLPGLHAPRHKTFRGVHDGFQGIDGNLKVTPACTCSEGLFLFFTFLGQNWKYAAESDLCSSK